MKKEIELNVKVIQGPQYILSHKVFMVLYPEITEEKAKEMQKEFNEKAIKEYEERKAKQ